MGRAGGAQIGSPWGSPPSSSQGQGQRTLPSTPEEEERMETGCLQVPDWTGQRCWLGSSSCCCCCWCFPRQSSWCCPLTSSFSGACWAAAVLAPLVEDGDIHGQPQQEEAGAPQPLLCKPHFFKDHIPPPGSITTLLTSTALLSSQTRGQERQHDNFHPCFAFHKQLAASKQGALAACSPALALWEGRPA